MSAQHTNEPWMFLEVDGLWSIKNRNGVSVIPDMQTFVSGEDDRFVRQRRDWRRIVATMNACAGIPTKVLEALAREPGDGEDYGEPTTIRGVCQEAAKGLSDAYGCSFMSLDALAGDYD